MEKSKASFWCRNDRYSIKLKSLLFSIPEIIDKQLMITWDDGN